MSTGTVPPTATSPAKKKKKKKKSPSMTEVVFSNFWKLLVGFVVLFLLVSSLFHGGGDARPEQFNPQKMSQVPKVWPRPAWAPRQDVEPARVNTVQQGLQDLERKLQNGLKSIPQYNGREYDPELARWHGPIPVRPAPKPFQFYANWAADRDCSNR